MKRRQTTASMRNIKLSGGHEYVGSFGSFTAEPCFHSGANFDSTGWGPKKQISPFDIDGL
jgi:hypothetical protein